MLLAFSPDGKYGIGKFTKYSKCWNISDGQKRSLVWNMTIKFMPVAFSPDGKYVVSGSNDGTASIFGMH